MLINGMCVQQCMLSNMPLSFSFKVLMQAEKPVEQYTNMTSVAFAAIICFLPTGIVAAVYSCMV